MSRIMYIFAKKNINMANKKKTQASRLKALIKDKGFKQKWIAQKVEVSEGHLNRVLQGQHTLTKALYDKITNLIN